MLRVLPPQIEPVLQQIRGSFLESPGTFSGAEAVLCCSVFIQDESFNNFENNAMKLLLNDAKSTGLWARNCATIEQFLILKFALGPETFPGVSRNRAQVVASWVNTDFLLDQITRESRRTREFYITSCTTSLPWAGKTRIMYRLLQKLELLSTGTFCNKFSQPA